MKSLLKKCLKYTEGYYEYKDKYEKLLVLYTNLGSKYLELSKKTSEVTDYDILLESEG